MTIQSLDINLLLPLLLGNQYKFYPQPDIPDYNCFFWLLLWLTYLEVAHYNQKLESKDYIFSVIRVNDIVHHGTPNSYNTVQAWIDEANMEAKILWGADNNFMTHTFWCSGTQWC